MHWLVCRRALTRCDLLGPSKIASDAGPTDQEKEAKYMDALAGKVALVTGAAKGMGREISLMFARNGARVAIAARRIEDAERVAAEIGDAALAVALDVTDRAA